MEYLFDIVGLRYYALQADKWKSLFNADGTLRAAYVGQSLTLRHSPSDLTTYTIEALSDGQLWGNLCDFEKLVARSLLEGVESQALRAVITGGYAEVHSLKVSVRSDVMPQIVERNDLSAYEQWYASAKGYPSLELTQEEQQLDRLVFSLEEQLSRGSWNHQLLEDVLAIGAIDLSEEMNTRRLKLLTRMDNSGDAEIQLDRQRLFTATVHKGSREERRRWASHLLDDVSGTREMDLLRLQLRQASSDELEALLISFPRNVFALWQIDPVLAIATLDYAHLPRQNIAPFPLPFHGLDRPPDITARRSRDDGADLACQRLHRPTARHPLLLSDACGADLGQRVEAADSLHDRGHIRHQQRKRLQAPQFPSPLQRPRHAPRPALRGQHRARHIPHGQPPHPQRAQVLTPRL
jgi:hypothetical protein